MKQDKTASMPRVFGVPGLKIRESRAEVNEDQPLDVRNSIHKEASVRIPLMPIVAWTLYQVDTSTYDLRHRLD